MSEKQDMKGKVLQGGLYLAIRNIISMGLSIASILVMARTLGPEKYGVVSVALGIFYFVLWTNKLGLNVYLVRQPNLPPTGAAQIAAFYNVVGLGVGVLLWLLAPALSAWVGKPELVPLIRVLPIPIWLEIMSSVPISLLDRELQFKQIGVIEIAAQMTNYALTIPLVLTGWSYWSPILGVVGYATVMFSFSRYYRPIPLQWGWENKFLQAALQYGLTYCGSDWVFSLRTLTIPLLVSRLAGLQAAGIASITYRLVDQLSCMRPIVRRIAISAIAKLLNQPEQVRQIINRAMSYQAILVGGVFATFAGFATWVIPLVFGQEWLPSAQLFPLLAIAILVGSLFDLHSSALYAAAHNREVAIANACYISIVWIAAVLLLQPFGWWGYGMAEVIALPSYFLLHRSLKSLCGSPDYSTAFTLVFAAIPPLFIGIWFSWIFSVLALLISYGSLLLLSQRVRQIPVELHSVWRSRFS